MKEKNYQNPIPKPKMVELPVWEYEKLVARSTMLGVIEALVKSGEKYKATDVMEALLCEPKSAKEE